MAVPIAVRHGDMSMSSAASARAKETSKKAWAVRWQTTKASKTRALMTRTLLLNIRAL